MPESDRQWPAARPPQNSYPNYRSHYLPRSAAGWLATFLFVGLMALAQPPFVHRWANRIEPWLFGLPFLYAYLLLIYFALIGVLLWIRRQEL